MSRARIVRFLKRTMLRTDAERVTVTDRGSGGTMHYELPTNEAECRELAIAIIDDLDGFAGEVQCGGQRSRVAGINPDDGYAAPSSLEGAVAAIPASVARVLISQQQQNTKLCQTIVQQSQVLAESAAQQIELSNSTISNLLQEREMFMAAHVRQLKATEKLHNRSQERDLAAAAALHKQERIQFWERKLSAFIPDIANRLRYGDKAHLKMASGIVEKLTPETLARVVADAPEAAQFFEQLLTDQEKQERAVDELAATGEQVTGEAAE